MIINAVKQLIFSGDTRAQLRTEFRTAKAHLLSKAKFPVANGRHLKVNIACGPNAIDGWVNIDAFPSSAATICWDCRRSIPLADGSASIVFTEHFFEHLDRPVETGRFLSECRRVLEPGGVVRLVVPDAGRYLNLYGEPGWDSLVEMRPLKKRSEGYADGWFDQLYSTKMEFINSVFRQFGQHKFAYDAETLILTLRDAGFENVAQQSFGISQFSQDVPDLEKRRSESLYVEGVTAAARKSSGLATLPSRSA